MHAHLLCTLPPPPIALPAPILDLLDSAASEPPPIEPLPKMKTGRRFGTPFVLLDDELAYFSSASWASNSDWLTVPSLLVLNFFHMPWTLGSAAASVALNLPS